MRDSTVGSRTLKSPRSNLAASDRGLIGAHSRRSGRAEGRIRAVDDLSLGERDQMYSLMTGHFSAVTKARFEADLSEKSWVCTITDFDSRRMTGFSTLMRFEVPVNGETVAVLYSGDTIVARASRWQQPLYRAMGRHMLSLAESSPQMRTLWLLLSSGYKTYRFLPVFWREFFPRYDAPTPPGTRKLIDAVARIKFKNEYDPEAGIVRFAEPAPLRPGIAEVDHNRGKDPHVAFFLQANPGHAAGDELVCLTEVTRSNLTPAGHRIFREAPTGAALIR